MKPYRIEKRFPSGGGTGIENLELKANIEDSLCHIIVGEFDKLPDARAAVGELSPGEYSIVHVLNDKVVVAPPPSATRNVVDFGTSTVARGPRTKPAEKPSAKDKK